MTRPRRFDTFTPARVCRCAIALAAGAGALAASGCGVDLSLGALDPEASPPLADGDPSAVSPTYADGTAPARIENPAVTLRLGSAYPSVTNNLSVGDLDADGLDDMAMFVRDEASGAEYIHLRYGAPRPIDEVDLLAFNESGARLIVRVASAPPVIVNGVHPLGDVDADGFADLFVQTSTNHLTQGNGGYLLYGGPERLSGIQELRAITSHLDPGVRLDHTPTSLYSFAAPGDIDGDGFDDLAMTNPEATALEPGVYVFYGRAARLAAETPWSEAELLATYPRLEPRLVGSDVDVDGDGVADPTQLMPLQPVLSAGGDIDGDGRAELLVSYSNLNGAAGVDRRVIVIRGGSRSAGALDLLELQPQLKYPEAEASASVPFPWASGLGDLDGDGNADFSIGAAPGGNHVFYGDPALLSGSLQLSQAAATLAGVSLLPVGDRDGDGDDELMALRSLDDDRLSLRERNDFGWALALTTISGSRTRLSGEVTIFPELRPENAHVYPENWQRLASAVMSAGDLDDDGATELITLSRGTALTTYAPAVEPQLHIHYGVHVPPVATDSPR